MATIVTRAGKGSPLTHNEVDANFTNLNTAKAEISSLGTAAFTATTAYATAAQGALADTANQPATTVAKTAATGSAVIPTGTTGQQDGSPAAGYLRFNTTDTSFEGYDGSAWGSIGGGATSDAIYENSATILENITIATGRNGMSTGPISVAGGVTVTVSERRKICGDLTWQLL
jgi:hypothetical protein